jgi:hypothetical protein
VLQKAIEHFYRIHAIINQLVIILLETRIDHAKLYQTSKENEILSNH